MSKKLTRRQIIIGGAGAATLAVPLGYVLTASIGGYPEVMGLQVLTSKEAAIIEAIGEVIIPNINEIGLSIRDAKVVSGIDDLMKGMTEAGKARFRMLFWMTEHTLPLRSFYFGKFSKLNLEKRTYLVQRLEASRLTTIRAFGSGLKGIIQIVYYNEVRVVEKLGFIDRCHL